MEFTLNTYFERFDYKNYRVTPTQKLNKVLNVLINNKVTIFRIEKYFERFVFSSDVEVTLQFL